MFLPRPMALAGFVAAVFVLAATLTGAAMTPKRTTHFTFKTHVALPGVVLPPGSYLFEIANPDGGADVVRVFDRTRSRLYVGALTRRTTRPLSNRLDAVIVFGEAGSSAPRRINEWYAAGDTSGREFLY